MRTYTIKFNTSGYDGFIDFIKAYAILCVLLGHSCLPVSKIGYGLWAGMQVPLFVLIQTFHSYKKEYISLNLRNIFRRVMLPFLILELVVFVIAFLFSDTSGSELVRIFISKGGYGNGSYYPWIYLQIAFLLPLFSFLLKSYNRTTSLIWFLVICEGFELLFSFTDFSDRVYRLLAIRYIFLLYFGYVWVKDGIKINAFSILLSTISLLSIIYFEYFSTNDEPFFYQTGWKYHRWPCFYFVANGLTALLYFLWKRFHNIELIQKCVRMLAISSYEIFLCQMTIRFFFPRNATDFLSNSYLSYILWFLIFWGTSITIGIVWNKLSQLCFINHNYLTKRTP